MSDSLKVQTQIRQNAEELSHYMVDLQKWEKTMNKKQKNSLPKNASKPLPIRDGGTVQFSKSKPTKSSNIMPEDEKSKTAAHHTYDIGYKRWENFDIEKACEDVDKEESIPTEDNSESYVVTDSEAKNISVTDSSSSNNPVLPSSKSADNRFLSPSNVVEIRTQKSSAPVPKPRGQIILNDGATAERELGNSAFQAGNFSQAVKHYTRSLGLGVRIITI
jgi:hypothetical protein